MAQSGRKTKVIHIVLIVLICLVALGLFFELSIEGIKWFTRQTGRQLYGKGTGVEFRKIEIFKPGIALQETANEYVIICDLPGMSKEENNVKADYNNGILTIKIPKQKSTEETKPKKVEII